MLGDHAAEERGQKLNIADIEVAVGDLLGDDAGGDGSLAQSAVLLGKIDADQAERAHLPQQVAVRAMLLGPFPVAWRELFPGKALGGLLESLLLLRQSEIHGHILRHGLAWRIFGDNLTFVRKMQRPMTVKDY